MAVLTDGREWHFFLPGEPGDYGERRVYKLDLAERDVAESALRFERYLDYSVANQTWAMDFLSDTLFDDQRFRLLTVVDCFSRESLAIVPRAHFRAAHVVDVLDGLTRERGAPQTIRCDIQTRCISLRSWPKRPPGEGSRESAPAHHR